MHQSLIWHYDFIEVFPPDKKKRIVDQKTNGLKNLLVVMASAWQSIFSHKVPEIVKGNFDVAHYAHIARYVSKLNKGCLFIALPFLCIRFDENGTNWFGLMVWWVKCQIWLNIKQNMVVMILQDFLFVT